MMPVLTCILEVELPLYEPLSTEVEKSKRHDSSVEKTKTGVRILMTSDDVSSLTAIVNYWLRLIKASLGVYKVI